MRAFRSLSGSRAGRLRLGLAIGAGLAAALLSLLVSSSPTYDPWSWLVWGREVGQLDLDTRAGPVWKPLPVMFTTVLSVTGDAAPRLWLVVARAGALLAVVMAYRLGCRLAGRVAGLAAALALLTTDELVGYLAPMGMSEPLLAAAVLAAFERHLAGRRGQGFAAGVAACLLRPEAWPFLGLYALWLWRSPPSPSELVTPRRSRHRGVGGAIATLVAIPALWYLPELWGAGDLFRSSRRAQIPTEGGPLLQDVPGLAVLETAARYPAAPVAALAGVALVFAVVAYARRRQQASTLVVGLAALAWTALVAVMAQARLAAGDRRYLFVPVVLAAVLAGVGVARLVAAAAARAPRWGGALAAVVLAAAATPAVVNRASQLDEDLDGLRYQETLMADLRLLIDRAGGPAAVRSCGHTFSGPYMLPAVAWHMDLPIFEVRYFRFEPGAVFRSSPELGAPPEPLELPPELGYRTTTATGTWELRTACVTASGPSRS